MRAGARWVLVTALLGAALGLAGCGEDEADEPVEPEPEVEEEPDPEPEPEPEPEEDEPEDVTHVVQEGDTLSSIAADFGVALEEIVEANDLEDPDAILVGEELVIPDVDPEDLEDDEDEGDGDDDEAEDDDEG